MRWPCSPDTGYEIRALAVWGRARFLSVTEAPHEFHTWMGKKHFLFLSNRRDREPNPNFSVKGSGANHYPGAPAQFCLKAQKLFYLDTHRAHEVVKYVDSTSLQRRKPGGYNVRVVVLAVVISGNCRFRHLWTVNPQKPFLGVPH